MRNPILRSKWIVFTLFAVLAACSVMYWTGCSDKQDTANLVTSTQQSSLVKMTTEDPAVRSVMSVQDRHTAELLANNNVVGTATGLTPDGQLAVIVYLKEPVSSGKGGDKSFSLPTSLDGVPVIQRVTGVIRAMKGHGGGTSHTAKQTPPIELGTSGGWRYDLANGYCCGGTLGSLIQRGGTQYILSNYHVFWGDIVSGGNGRVATAGDPVIQPGLIDVQCNAALAQNVANLSGSGSLPSANVDAGYAQVIPGMVRTDGAILEVGTLSATTVGAFLGQAVKKSGRTTGLTRSTVSGLNATISVAYDNECAGGAAFTKTFTGQIVIANSGSKFLNSGDSGSLMEEDITTNPHAVGLLYAGSSFDAIANPIGAVLSWVGGGATMVGQ
jgi:hypothetical protein